jgi:hypothetical protein
MTEAAKTEVNRVSTQTLAAAVCSNIQINLSDTLKNFYSICAAKLALLLSSIISMTVDDGVFSMTQYELTTNAAAQEEPQCTW